MKIWQVILATLVIFGAGVMTGGLLVSYSDHAGHHQLRLQRPEAPHWPAVGNPPREPEKFSQPANISRGHGFTTNFVARLNRELNLTLEQRERIAKIIHESQERTKELWKQVEQPMRKEIQETREKIRTELTPEQKQKFEELVQRPQRKPEETRRPLPQPVRPPQNP